MEFLFWALPTFSDQEFLIAFGGKLSSVGCPSSLCHRRTADSYGGHQVIKPGGPKHVVHRAGEVDVPRRSASVPRPAPRRSASVPRRAGRNFG